MDPPHHHHHHLLHNNNGPADETARHRSASRLKRMSDATIRRLSIPLSLMSTRSSSPGRDNKKPHKTSLRNSISSRASKSENPRSSRRTSMASTTRTRSSVAPGTGIDNVGALPVFGVAQRGYLASLVSLFSDGNVHDHTSSLINTPVSANTAITDPSIGAPSLGPYEYETNSTAIYRFSKARRLYVGWPSIVHPPPEALLEFEMETLPLLERDLQGVSGHLGQQGIRITYELRMSGYASPTADTVTLAPTVWILYRSYSSVRAKVSVAELHQAVSEIFYLQRSLEIQEGGGRIELCSDRGLVKVKLDDKDSIKLADGSKLSIHIEDCQDKYSVCGALCCVTIEEGPRAIQSLCRIGGLLKVNGKYILGVSTAHAMLDSSGIFRDSFDDSPESRLPQGEAVDRDLISSEVKRVSKWHNVTRDAAVDFLGISMNSRGEMAINRSKPENATDFALLRLRKMPNYVRNKYIPPRSEEAVSVTSTASASAAALDEGPVYILCGGGHVADGQLVWGSACFIVRGRNFRVRRIQTTRPLNAGAAGAWVVRGEVLYGVIIAVYENEPFALMMTAERLFGSVLGSAFSIRSVELWDGEVPDILKAHSAAHAQKAAVPKEVVLVNTKPRSKTKTEDVYNEEVGESSSRPMNGESMEPEFRTRSEATQTDVRGCSTDNPAEGPRTGDASCSPVPRTAEGGTQTEDSQSPSTEPVNGESATRESATREAATTEAIADGGAQAVKHDVNSFSSRAMGRQRSPSRVLSKASDVTMSGAVQMEDPPVSRDKGSTARSGASTSANENYITPQSTVSTGPDRNFGITTEISAGRPQTGDGSMRDGDSRNASAGKSGSKNRRNSLQIILDKTFRRSSSRGGPEYSKDHNYGIPPTGLDGRPVVFNKRHSSTVASLRPGAAGDRNSRISSYSIPPGGSDDKLSIFKRRPSTKESTRPRKDSNHGIPPGGLDDRLKLFRRRSSRVPQEPERSDKVKNFGIPPGGL